MFFWAFFFDYDFLSFFGIRQALDFRKTKNINPPDKIKKTGLLGIIRHPMYTALIIYLWCQTLRLTDIVVNAVLTIYIIIGTYLEEKKLVLEFGDTYIRYQHEVPMLIPLIKKRK
jgi:protein-S-isoprenylcysteine O-methyltransferase Ste14